jgi:hypothetical protein
VILACLIHISLFRQWLPGWQKGKFIGLALPSLTTGHMQSLHPSCIKSLLTQDHYHRWRRQQEQQQLDMVKESNLL